MLEYISVDGWSFFSQPVLFLGESNKLILADSLSLSWLVFLQKHKHTDTKAYWITRAPRPLVPPPQRAIGHYPRAFLCAAAGKLNWCALALLLGDKEFNFLVILHWTLNFIINNYYFAALNIFSVAHPVWSRLWSLC